MVVPGLAGLLNPFLALAIQGTLLSVLQITSYPEVPACLLGRAVWRGSWSPGTGRQYWTSQVPLSTSLRLQERLEGHGGKEMPHGCAEGYSGAVVMMGLEEESLSP